MYGIEESTSAPRKRKNIGKYGVFLVVIGSEGCAVIQTVEYDDTGGVYCLLFRGLCEPGDLEAGMDIATAGPPVCGVGLIKRELAEPEFTFAGRLRPSLHYEPRAYRIGDRSVIDFSLSIYGNRPADEGLDYCSQGNFWAFIDEVRVANGLPIQELAVEPHCLQGGQLLSEYVPAEKVQSHLAELDRLAGYDA